MKKRLSAKSILLNLDTVLAAVALVLLILVTFIGVIMRYCLGAPLIWQEEVQLAMIVWVVFLGGRYAFLTGSHPAIDFIVDSFPAKARKVADIVITVVSVVVLAYVGYQGARYVGMMFQNHRVTNISHIPYGMIYLPMPIGCLLMCGQMIVDAIRKPNHQEEREE